MKPTEPQQTPPARTSPSAALPWRKILVAAGLLAIAAGAVVLVILTTISASPDSDPRGLQNHHFKCSKPDCGREFEIPVRQYSAWAAKAKPSPENLGRADCPWCQAKFSGVKMGQCPTCRRHFLAAQARHGPADGAGRVELTCPYCGASVGRRDLQRGGGEPRVP